MLFCLKPRLYFLCLTLPHYNMLYILCIDLYFSSRIKNITNPVGEQVPYGACFWNYFLAKKQIEKVFYDIYPSIQKTLELVPGRDGSIHIDDNIIREAIISSLENKDSNIGENNTNKIENTEKVTSNNTTKRKVMDKNTDKKDHQEKLI